jgi:hypothetical protein
MYIRDFVSTFIFIHSYHRHFMDFRPVTHSHLWLAFASTLRVVASAFSRLHRALTRFTIARSRMAEYQRQPFGTLPPHLTVQIISSHSFYYGLVS